MAKFVTSDQHLGHWSINDYCNRGFKSVEEMDDTLIEAWNSVVGLQDVVYHLGDFCLGDLGSMVRYFYQLNGRIKILGNPHHHDGSWLRHLGKRGVYPSSRSGIPLTILPPIQNLSFPEYSKDGKHPRTLVLCHFPLQIWDRKHYGSWHLHGHTHKVVPQVFPAESRINVAVDARVRRTWKPISLTWIANVFQELEKSKEK